MEFMGKNKKIATIALSIYLLISGVWDLFIPQVRSNGWYALISIALIWLIPWFVGKLKLEISDLTYILFMVFIVLGTYTNNRYNLCRVLWWFDIALHLSSGVMLSLIAGDIFFPLSKKHVNHLWFELFFMFVFAVASAGFWEILEFSFDCITGLDVQRNLTRDREFIAMSWQNNGIIDTMNDMINGTVGGLIGCTIGYFQRKKLCKKVFAKTSKKETKHD